jgi:hypothetical protein
MTTHITKTWFDGEKVVTQEIPESEVYTTEQTEAQRLADELDAYHTAPHHKQAAAELRRLEAEVERKSAGIKFLWQECDQQEVLNAQLLEALRDMVNTLTDGPDESDIARVFSVARAAIAAAKGEA